MAQRLDRPAFDYSQVRLVPGHCAVASRSEVDVSVQLGPHRFELPVVPANMSTIVDEDLAEWLAYRGYFYVMHRFDIDPVDHARRMNEKDFYSSISVGVQGKDFADVERLAKNVHPDYVTVDIAHGDAPSVIKMVQHLKKNLPNTYVIAGNVGTPAGLERLKAAGADAGKLGIGPGAACLTSPNTGFGTRDWQLSALEWCSSEVSGIDIIADGGVREYGDIAKSIAFGASMVMVGGMFGGHTENPGEVFEDSDGSLYKVFFGSASEHQKGEVKHVEGKKLHIPFRGSLATTFQHVRENLQSAVSYSGGQELFDLRNAQYVVV